MFNFIFHPLFFRYRLVTAIGDAYGIALLLHMLTSTIILTLLAYQATKVKNIKYRLSFISDIHLFRSMVWMFMQQLFWVICCTLWRKYFIFVYSEIVWSKRYYKIFFRRDVDDWFDVFIYRVPQWWRRLTAVIGMTVQRRRKPSFKLYVNNAKKLCLFRELNSLPYLSIYLLQ